MQSDQATPILRHTDTVGTITFSTEDGYQNVITIRREDVSTTAGAYRCVIADAKDEVAFVLSHLRTYTERAPGR